MKTLPTLLIFFVYWLIFIPLLNVCAVLTLGGLSDDVMQFIPDISLGRLIAFYVISVILALWVDSFPTTSNKIYFHLGYFIVLFLFVCKMPRQVSDFILFFVLLCSTYLSMIVWMMKKKEPMKKSKKVLLWSWGGAACLGGLGMMTYPLLNTEDIEMEQLHLYSNVNNPEPAIRTCLEKMSALKSPFTSFSFGKMYSWVVMVNTQEEADKLSRDILTLLKDEGFERRDTIRRGEADTIEIIITKSEGTTPFVLSVDVTALTG